MNAIARIGLGATLALLALACSGRSLGSAGTGGTDGVFTGDGPGSGGQGGGTGGAGVAATLELPGCLRDLLGPCVPQGSCVAQSVSPDVTDACFETGVRASQISGSTLPGICSNGGVSGVVVHVSKADGTRCYTYETAWDASCQIRQYVWKDTAGNIVASGMSSSSPNWTTAINCTVTRETALCGEPRSLPLPDGCCGLSELGAAACTAGARTSYCPSGSCPGVGGTGGGGMGGGGRGGAGGSVGGTGGAADLEAPDCLKDLVASCATDGACTVPLMDGGPETYVCFDSGVRGTFATVDDTSSCGGRRVVQVTRADGSPCYSYEKYGVGATLCEGTAYIWKDAAGQVVATGTSNPYSNPTHQVTCANAGQKKVCHNPIITSNTGACCAISELGVAGCGPPIVHGRCRTGTCP